jgi:hypothetical protein
VRCSGAVLGSEDRLPVLEHPDLVRRHGPAGRQVAESSDRRAGASRAAGEVTVTGRVPVQVDHRSGTSSEVDHRVVVDGVRPPVTAHSGVRVGRRGRGAALGSSRSSRARPAPGRTSDPRPPRRAGRPTPPGDLSPCSPVGAGGEVPGGRTRRGLAGGPAVLDRGRGRGAARVGPPAAPTPLDGFPGPSTRPRAHPTRGRPLSGGRSRPAAGGRRPPPQPGLPVPTRGVSGVADGGDPRRVGDDRRPRRPTSTDGSTGTVPCVPLTSSERTAGWRRPSRYPGPASDSRASRSCRHASVRATSLNVKKWRPCRWWSGRPKVGARPSTSRSGR